MSSDTSSSRRHGRRLRTIRTLRIPRDWQIALPVAGGGGFTHLPVVWGRSTVLGPVTKVRANTRFWVYDRTRPHLVVCVARGVVGTLRSFVSWLYKAFQRAEARALRVAFRGVTMASHVWCRFIRSVFTLWVRLLRSCVYWVRFLHWSTVRRRHYYAEVARCAFWLLLQVFLLALCVTGACVGGVARVSRQTCRLLWAVCSLWSLEVFLAVALVLWLVL